MPKSLRVLNVSLGGGRAGSGIFATSLSKKMTQLGHHIIQVCSSGSFTLLNAKKENLPTYIMDINGLFEFRKAGELAKFSAENKIQVINTHHSGERYLAIFAKLIFACKAKIVITRHAVSGTTPFFGTLIYNIGSDMNIAVSKVVYESLRRDLTWKKRLIYGGIEVEKFTPPSPGEIEQLKKIYFKTDFFGPVIGMVADYDPMGKNQVGRGKGHAVLFEAIKNIKQKVKLLLIGPDHLNCKDLLNLAIKTGLSEEQICIIPFQENIIPFYYLMDLHVLPSYSESLGLVTLEAMAAGVPCIGTNIGGINEIITHNENGLLFSKGNSLDLANQISRLLENPPFKDRLAQAGKKTVQRFFTMDRVACETSELFYGLMEKE